MSGVCAFPSSTLFTNHLSSVLFHLTSTSHFPFELSCEAVIFDYPTPHEDHRETNMTEDTKPRTFNPLGVPPPPPTYNHVCVTPLIPGSVDLVTLAGLTGFIPSDISSPKTIKEQAPIAYGKIKTCLAAAGATPRDIVQVRHYIVNETGDPVVDKLDVVERGWGDAWVSLHRWRGSS